MVEGKEKTAVLNRVEDFFRSKATEFSVFELGDFRDSDRHAMLVVQERC